MYVLGLQDMGSHEKVITSFSLYNCFTFQNFQAGEVNRFLMKTPVDIGIPLQIKVWHDNSGQGSKAGWFLAKIVLVDLQRKKWYETYAVLMHGSLPSIWL